jgi:molecular chaperone Hsp33
VGRILVDGLSDGSVRGCLQRRLAADAAWESFAGRPVLGDFVGRTGVAVVTRDLGLQQQYQGTIAVTSGEIDADLERYLLHSEQIPSVLVCEVVVDAAGRVARAAGVLVQTFPAADPAALLPARAALQAGALYALLGQPRTAEQLMGAALAGATGRTLARSRPHFVCTCGRERALSILSTLGAEELESLATEPGPTEVRCSFCGDTWNVTEAELRELAGRLRRERS